MKKYLRLFITNILFYIPASLGLYFNDYHFFIKTFYIIYILLAIIVFLFLTAHDTSFTNFYKKNKDKCKNYYSKNLYLVFVYLTDIPFLITFVVLDYKFIFILYFIQIICEAMFHGKIKEKLKEEKSND